jgi:hypothetical protein
MEARYRGHTIKVRGFRNFLGDNVRAQVTILWEEDGITRVQPFTLNRACTTEDEAANLGVLFTRQWIDHGRPTPTFVPVW